ncbi:MAG TPA: DUF5666 domain-containing protein [Chthoniobacterales bacterium]|jgi:hypothetical protein
MKSKILILSAVLTGIAVFATGISAKDKKAQSPSPSPASSPQASAMMKKTRALPYHGKVVSVDASARSFVVGKRTFAITNDTQITKDNAPAALSDIMSGEMVGGSYWKKDDGTMEARTVRIGTKSTTTSASASDARKKDEKKK